MHLLTKCRSVDCHPSLGLFHAGWTDYSVSSRWGLTEISILKCAGRSHQQPGSSCCSPRLWVASTGDPIWSSKWCPQRPGACPSCSVQQIQKFVSYLLLSKAAWDFFHCYHTAQIRLSVAAYNNIEFHGLVQMCCCIEEITSPSPMVSFLYQQTRWFNLDQQSKLLLNASKMWRWCVDAACKLPETWLDSRK